MKNLFLYLVAVSVILIVSCGEKYEELKNAAEVIKNAPEAAEEMSKSVDLAEKKREERRAKGDTLALHFSELQKYLPESLSGLKSEEPNGQTTNVTGFSMSTIERDYVAENGSNRSVKIVLMDYNESYAMFAGVTYWTALGMSTETNDGFTKSVKSDITDVAGFEEYSKSARTAKISYAVGYRFLLTIEENEATGTDYIKDIAKKIDLKKLASL